MPSRVPLFTYVEVNTAVEVDQHINTSGQTMSAYIRQIIRADLASREQVEEKR